MNTSRDSRSDDLSMAEALADQIWQKRAHTWDGGVTWLKPEPGAATGASVHPYLYDGTAGIALFYAALSRVTGSSEARERSLLAIAPVRRKFAEIVADSERAAALGKVGIGGFLGLGSLVYSFVWIGRLLGEHALLAEAADLSRLFTRDRISNDSIRDVLLGSAGAVLSLLALHEALGEGRDAERVLETACDCARNLLSGRSSSDDGTAAWPTLPGFPPLTGLSHGAAGLCAAFLSLYEKTEAPELLQAAHECLAFERRAFHPGQQNWRDTRYPDRLHFNTSWCYGAPGIALARLRTLRVLDDPQVRDEIRTALETTRGLRPLTPLDHLCCGNMGRVETLIFASSRLGDEDLQAAARRLAAEVLERQRSAGGFRWRFEQEQGFFDPTFFTGAAGIGYTLLRLAHPRTLPCVAILE